MPSLRTNTIIGYIRTFFKEHKKVVITTLVLFLVGIVLGIFFAVKAVDGNFEKIPRSEIETGTSKVFFLSLLLLVFSYFIILISGANNKTAILICIPFFVLGYLLGRDATALICRYGGFGILNLLLVYLPFFILTFLLMLFAASYVSVLYTCCTENCEKYKPSFIFILKMLAINALVSLVFILIIGSIIGGVIVVELF